MIIERNVFQVKFGRMKEALAIWKEIFEAAKSSPLKTPEMRMLTDISGPSYTLVLEIHIAGFNELNPKNAVWSTNEKFQELYHKFIPLCDSAHRSFYKIEQII